MKKQIFNLLVLVLCLILFTAYGNAEGFLENFSFKLSTGMGNTMGGDMVDIVAGTNAEISDISSIIGIPVQGKLKNVNWGPDFECELFLKLSENFGVGLGFVYMKRKKDSTIEINIDESTGSSLSWEPKYTAFPINLSGYYHFPVTQKVKAFLRAGASYYFAKLDFILREENRSLTGGNEWIQNAAKAKDNGIGIHGGIGFEYNISKNISIFLEGSGKYVKFKDWEVEVTHTQSGGVLMDVEGSLWYLEEYNLFTDKYYPNLQLSDTKPSAPWVRNAREAEISFSGFSIRIGIKIGLGR